MFHKRAYDILTFNDFKSGMTEDLMTTNTQIMGIVNLTPDSFSDGGLTQTLDDAIRQIQLFSDQGADWIDIGAESSRPGADPVSLEDEWARLAPILKAYQKVCSLPLSLDTTKAEIARRGLDLGVSMINDISAGQSDPDMFSIVAKQNCPIVLMHMQGTPQTMQKNIRYDDVIKDVYHCLDSRVSAAKDAGIQDIWIDPGIGFGKTPEQNLTIIKSLDAFKPLNCPILIGTSRKSFIHHVFASETHERLPGSLISAMVSVQNGADVVRVHDVKQTKEAMMMLEALTHV